MLGDIVHGGISLETASERGNVRLLCYFRHRWLDFRLPEIEAVVPRGVQLHWSLPYGGNTLSPFWYLSLPSLDVAHTIAKRSVLLKALIEIWGEGATYEELRVAIERCPEAIKAPFYPESVTFRVNVCGWGHKVSLEEQVEAIERLSYLPLKGPVNLKTPDETYWLIIADPSRMSGFPGVPYRLYFGRQIAISDLSVIQRYALPRRAYLGPTSMDAEMALVMCNHAKVQKGSLVMDPFVGTGSILVAASHFGGITMGCDIDVKILKQTKQSKKGTICDIWSNFSSYGLSPPIGLLICDMHQSPFKSQPLEMFDAVICDPPYGVRAGSRKQSHQDSKGRTQHYTVGEMCRDLLDFAARMLLLGGRLVYFCPSLPGGMSAEDLPSHPMLQSRYCCEQYLTMKYTRCLITMEKIRPYDASLVADFHAAQGPPCMPIDDIHDRVFDQPFQETSPIPKFRCKQL